MATEGSKEKGLKEPTVISVSGFFSKEHIAKLLRFLFKIQKKVNPKNKKNKVFLIWISNTMYSDEEVRKIIKDNFKDKRIIELDNFKDKRGIGG